MVTDYKRDACRTELFGARAGSLGSKSVSFQVNTMRYVIQRFSQFHSSLA